MYKIIDTDRPDDSKYRFLTYVGPKGNFNYKNQWKINPDAIDPGIGYWLAARKFIKPFNSGLCNTVANHKRFDSNYFHIPLVKGYNQIGNPYLFDVSWKDVLAVNDTLIGPLTGWVQNDTKTIMEEVSDLKKFSGGYVYAEKATILKIPARKKLATCKRELMQPFSHLVYD